MFARRFAALLLYTFVPNTNYAFLLAFLLATTNVISLWLHVVIQPFKAPHLQDAETVSLFILVLLSLLNMRSAMLQEELIQVERRKHNRDFFEVIEVLLLLLPALFAGGCFVFQCAKRIDVLYAGGLCTAAVRTRYRALRQVVRQWRFALVASQRKNPSEAEEPLLIFEEGYGSD